MPDTKNTRTRFEGAEPILSVKDMAVSQARPAIRSG